MSVVDDARDAYQGYLAARAVARRVARSEVEDWIESRIDELTGQEAQRVVDALREAKESGLPNAEIRGGVFGTNAPAWTLWSQRAGIPKDKPGRKPETGNLHGRNSMYTRGCRCDDCKAASREYRDSRKVEG